MGNTFKTAFLLTALTLLLMFFGRYFGGENGVLLALVFAAGVTHGILGLLNDEELEGVLAHELGHVGNRDILISSVAATIAGAITMLASMGRFAMIFGGVGGGDRDRRDGGGFGALLMLILAPIAGSLIQLAVSRSR